jgi:hypothetical protein
VFSSDASTRAFGFLLEQGTKDFLRQLPADMHVGHGVAALWDDSLATFQQHSGAIGYGELYAVVACLTRFRQHLRGKHALFMCDNKGDVFSIMKGRSACPRTRALLRSLADICREFDILVHAEHRPGDINYTADWLSRPEKWGGGRSHPCGVRSSSPNSHA